MNTKKIAIMASFVTALAYANFVSAANWTPLVRIPGLPATGHVDLSMYLVGLYNFLLSIVGIVAVMMLIIGGMRYITAAGNAAAISDAKDIVSNAIVGLLLALLSWVFIATINPDVLYIKQPGSGFNTTDVHGSCHRSFDPIAGTCVCMDGVPAPAPPYADPKACNDECYDLDHCMLPDSYTCIAPGSPNDFEDETFKKESTYNKRCKCIDDVFVTPNWAAIEAMPGTQTCNDVCSDPALAGDVKYHCLVVNAKIAEIPPDITVFTFPPLEELLKYAQISSPSDPLVIEADVTPAVLIDPISALPINMALSYGIDTNGDFICDFLAPNDVFFLGYPYAFLAGHPECTQSGDLSYTCAIKICATDTAGNTGESMIYFKMLAP